MKRYKQRIMNILHHSDRVVSKREFQDLTQSLINTNQLGSHAPFTNQIRRGKLLICLRCGEIKKHCECDVVYKILQSQLEHEHD